MKGSSKQLRQRLKTFGFADPAVNAAWPSWWSDEAELSASAQAELRFSLSRKLGLDPKSLLDDDTPEFVWRDAGRFKHLKDESEVERAGITSFATALAVLLEANVSLPQHELVGMSATEIRRVLLRNRSFIVIEDLLAFCWASGVPVLHLRVFPWPRKRMSAMVLRTRSRPIILLAKDSSYPPDVAFYIAHELGHIALDQVHAGDAIVDLETNELARADYDLEEHAADSFAIELLTGNPNLTVLPTGKGRGSLSLANAALRASSELQIEPGMLALCFGYSTGNWRVAKGAMRHIYSQPNPVWRRINQIASGEVRLPELPDDFQSYLSLLLGQG